MSCSPCKVFLAAVSLWPWTTFKKRPLTCHVRLGLSSWWASRQSRGTASVGPVWLWQKDVAANHKLIEQSEWGNHGSGVTAGGNASNWPLFFRLHCFHCNPSSWFLSGQGLFEWPIFHQNINIQLLMLHRRYVRLGGFFGGKQKKTKLPKHDQTWLSFTHHELKHMLTGNRSNR